jgi:hypothetical protein
MDAEKSLRETKTENAEEAEVRSPGCNEIRGAV